MIRLRAAILRGLTHPWLGPALLLLLVVLFALVLLHLSIEQFLEASLACLGIVFTLSAIIPLLTPRRRSRPLSDAGQRAPPQVTQRPTLAPTIFDPPSPLRL